MAAAAACAQVSGAALFARFGAQRLGGRGA